MKAKKISAKILRNWTQIIFGNKVKVFYLLVHWFVPCCFKTDINQIAHLASFERGILKLFTSEWKGQTSTPELYESQKVRKRYRRKFLNNIENQGSFSIYFSCFIFNFINFTRFICSLFRVAFCTELKKPPTHAWINNWLVLKETHAVSVYWMSFF